MARTAVRRSMNERGSDHRLFESLLLHLSIRFINVPPHLVDEEIEGALRSVSEFLDIHKASLWQPSPKDPGKYRLTHLYQHPEYATVIRDPDGGLVPPDGWSLLAPASKVFIMEVIGEDLFPWVTRKVLAGEVAAVDSVDALPPEAERDRMFYKDIKTKSSLCIPLAVSGTEIIGVVAFDVVREERPWTREVIDDLQLISQVFANALARKSADLALRESQARLSLAATSAGIALWSIEISSGGLWTSDIGRELFPFSATEEATWERFLSFVHPDDRAAVEESYRQAIDGSDAPIEYRYVRPDGGVRWALSRGRVHADPAGRPLLLMGVTIDVTERKQMERRLQEQLEEISRYKRQLESDVKVLREEVQACQCPGEIHGASDAMKYVYFRIGQVAPLDATVLIQGETGTGKNLAAAAIHARSKRKDRPMVTVSCAALPGNLIESELFGRDRGAFTGADQMRRGRFEVADGSTIFLDEIGELPLDLQAKLLRVVQTGEFERLGSPKTIKVNARIIAASNRDLQGAVREGRFRADLFYRLNVFPITMPPLREHKGDIPDLVETLVERVAKRIGRRITTIPAPVLKRLQDYDWPGNVRELENVIERAVIVSTGPALKLAEPLPDRSTANGNGDGARGPGAVRLENVEREHIRRILGETGWRVQGKGGAADRLGLNPSTLRARMRKLGIRREAAPQR